MNLAYALRKIGDLEKTMAGLYRFYSNVFEQDESARKLFLKMERQEMGHYDQIQFQRRILDGESERMEFPEEELRTIDETIEKVSKHMGEGVFELRDALRFAIGIEEGAGEIHLASRLARINPGLNKLITALQRDDRTHCVDLKAFSAEFVRRAFG